MTKSASGRDDDWQLKALHLDCAGQDVQDSFVYLEETGTTYKTCIGSFKQPLSI